MGCMQSRDARRAQQYAVEGEDPAQDAKRHSAVKEAAKSHTPAPSAARPKLDPKDFQYVNLKGEAKVKAPGTINGQAFTVDNCHDCDLYILDHCGQVTVDDCNNCRLYIGPTDGSVFIRNCNNCTVAVVCRQLRTRDCNSCNVSLYCRTRPIVESSTSMGFSCLDLPYPELEAHMRKAKLSPLHNFWWHIYDFTAKPGNWHLLAPDTTARGLLGALPAEAEEFVQCKEQQGAEAGEQQGAATGAEELSASPLLRTLGDQRPEHPGGGAYLLALYDGGRKAQALQLASYASSKGWLLHSNQAKLQLPAATALAAEAALPKGAAKAIASADGDGCIGLELLVPSGELSTLQERVKREGGLSSTSEAAGASFRGMGVDG